MSVLQDHIKRLLAFATIAYVGVFLIGLGLLSSDGVAGAAVYIVAQLALAVHLFHGAWSLFQSLGVNNPRFNGARRGFAIAFAAIVCGVNISSSDDRFSTPSY